MITMMTIAVIMKKQTKPKWTDLYTDLTCASVSKKSAPEILRLLRFGVRTVAALVFRAFFLGGIWVQDMVSRFQGFI